MEMNNSTPLPSKLRGCIIGQCLGDALGFPVEGRDSSDCRYYLSAFANKWFKGAEPEKSEWTGQYTDDSQLARELLISIVENSGWSPEDYAARIDKIFRENKIVGRGIACDNAARRLNRGISWEKAGDPPPSAGNGTAMRAAPVGMYFRDNPETMIRVAHEQGWITHQDPRCSAGSIAIAGAVALVLKDKINSVSEFADTLSNWMKDYHAEFASFVEQLPAWLELSYDEALDVISKAGKTREADNFWPGISPFVIPSVLWSLYSFLKYPDDYAKAISLAIMPGGDVDTTAAMTGAINGAYLGIDKLPQHLAEMVNDNGSWGYEELIGLVS